MRAVSQGVSEFVLTLALVSVVGALAASLMFGSAGAAASPPAAPGLHATVHP